MDYISIQQIIKAMSESNLTFLEIESNGVTIKMKKNGEEEVIKKAPKSENKQMDEISLESSETIEKEKKALEPKVDDNIVTITSPIVGTFYAAPSPDQDNFVSVGDKVKKGDTLCIIEAMKLMNEIDAEEDYEIVEILLENEDMVEYGQPIFKAIKL